MYHTALKAKLRGDLILPGDANYDQGRKLYNAMIDKRPALIARCLDVADVIACVNDARENGILLAIRGGGRHELVAGRSGGGTLDRLGANAHLRQSAAVRCERQGNQCENDAQAHNFATGFGDRITPAGA